MTTSRPLLPPRLRKGDTIGLFCPAGPLRHTREYEQGIALIRNLGFHFLVEGALENSGHYLADTDSARISALNTLWEDDQVQAIMAVRGGFGCLRMLPGIDWKRLRRHPKLLIGFSDVSALISGMVQQAGIVGIHGPVLTSLPSINERSLHQLFALMTGTAEDTIFSAEVEVLRGGTATGRLLGGNLTTLVHLIGTPWECIWDNAILVLEDTGESLYRIDRMLTQLALSGRLERIAGLVLGTFDPGTPDRLETIRLHEQVWHRVLELTEGPGYPVWGGFPAGHQEANTALPMGMEATMDGQGGKLRLHPQSVQVL